MTMAPALMLIDVVVAPPIDVGQVGARDRRCIHITGGKVSGSYSGAVLAGGADWQTIGPDGTIDLHARYVLDLDEGRVEVDSRGLRAGPEDVLARLARGELVDPALYYFRTALRFYTAAPTYDRLNRVLAVAHGERRPGGVRLSVYEVA